MPTKTLVKDDLVIDGKTLQFSFIPEISAAIFLQKATKLMEDSSLQKGCVDILYQMFPDFDGTVYDSARGLILLDIDDYARFLEMFRVAFFEQKLEKARKSGQKSKEAEVLNDYAKIAAELKAGHQHMFGSDISATAYYESIKSVSEAEIEAMKEEYFKITKKGTGTK